LVSRMRRSVRGEASKALRPLRGRSDSAPSRRRCYHSSAALPSSSIVTSPPCTWDVPPYLS
jgi:hypothetical protein